MLQSRDKDLTSHSLKVTGISWAAKAEIPREQRRLLGRHSSSLQDSDSIYARDLAFAPVQAFGRMIALIRDAHFFPDSSRDSFFKGSNPLVPGRPLPRFQPMTPVMPVAQPVEKEAHLDLGVPSELIEAKEELQMPINEGKPGEIISVTESDSTSLSAFLYLCFCHLYGKDQAAWSMKAGLLMARNHCPWKGLTALCCRHLWPLGVGSS